MAMKTIRAIIRRYFQENHTEEVDASFRKWFLDGNYEQEKENVLKEVWEETDAVADHSTRKDLGVLHRRIENTLPGGGKKYTFRPYLRIAAGILIVIVGGLSTYIFIQSTCSATTVECTESFVAGGQQKKIVLSDSSTVWLNSASVLL